MSSPSIRCPCAGIAAAIVLLLPCSGVTATTTDALSPTRVTTAPDQRFGEPRDVAFGFRIREERRYTLGPPDVLHAGESEQWIMRLESIDDLPGPAAADPRGRRIRFRLEHEATQVAAGGNLFGGDKMASFRGMMDLTVNEHGFPLRVTYRAERDDPRVMGSRERSTLEFDGAEFRLLTPLRMGRRQINLAIPAEPFVDLSVPRGAYLAAYENPGLYSLVLAGAGIREAREARYVSLAPSLFAGSDGPRGTRRSVVAINRLEFIDFTSVEIGGTRMQAMRLRRDGNGYVYAGEDGTVLRVDITIAGGRDAWIRLLRPSEY